MHGADGSVEPQSQPVVEAAGTENEDAASTSDSIELRAAETPTLEGV